MAVTFQTAADYQQNNGTNRQASLAVTFVGESVNDIFDTIPDNGTDAEFDKAVDKLNDYF